MSHIWKTDATIGAVTALGQYHRSINDSVLKRAEQLAIERSKRDGYDAAITEADVLQACEEDYREEHDATDIEIEIYKHVQKHGLYHANGEHKYSVLYNGRNYMGSGTKELYNMIMEDV